MVKPRFHQAVLFISVHSPNRASLVTLQLGYQPELNRTTEEGVDPLQNRLFPATVGPSSSWWPGASSQRETVDRRPQEMLGTFHYLIGLLLAISY